MSRKKKRDFKHPFENDCKYFQYVELSHYTDGCERCSLKNQDVDGCADCNYCNEYEKWQRNTESVV